MSLDSYTAIVASIKSWAQRDNLAASDYDDFLRMTETHMDTALRLQSMSQRSYTNTVAGQALYAMPADARGIRNIEVEYQNRRYALQYMSPEVLDEKFGGMISGGCPVAYSITGLDFELQPVPAGALPLRILYYRMIPALSGTNPTNWVVDRYPQLYLYGGLHFLSEFIRDDEASKYWGERFGNALSAASGADQEDRWSGATPEMVAT